MKQKLNKEALLEYSKTFAKRLNDYYFIDHNYIEGKEVLSFSDIKQVNLFVVKLIFEKWKDEVKRLKSPYFNYSNPKVTVALDNFMNLLSQNIHIQKNDFYPLLVEATFDALLLVLEPHDYFENEFKKVSNHTVNLNRLKDIAKYLTINKGLMGVLIEKMREKKIDELHNREMLALFSEVYEENKNYIEPMEFRIKAFSDIQSLDLNKIYANGAINTHKQFTAPSKKVKTNSSDEYHSIAQEALSKAKSQIEEGAKPNILSDFQQTKIHNLNSHISLNQKFIFIKELFKDNKVAYNTAIDDIEKSNDLKNAMDIVENKFALPYQWNEEENEHVALFYQLIQRRFLKN